jgi:hypothetical protein
VHHLKYRWEEDRGDEQASWGGSWWYFEISDDGYPCRQVEEYDSGVRLRYSAEHREDRFGGLGYGHESDMDRSADDVLSAEEFEEVWRQGPWYNAPT